MLLENAIAVSAGTLAAGLYAYAAMWPTSQLFGPTITGGPDPKEFALTFDDGPNDPYTGHLLDLLTRHGVRATFFMIGRFVRQRPDIARAVQSAGHLIGNHTMTHPVLLFQTPARVRAELAGCNAALEDVLGERVAYFRPPHGARRPDVLRAARELSLTPVMWNAMGYDWKPDTDPVRIERSLQRGIARNRQRSWGSNLLLHDGGQAGMGQDRSATVSAVANLLPRILREGGRLVSINAWDAADGRSQRS